MMRMGIYIGVCSAHGICISRWPVIITATAPGIMVFINSFINLRNTVKPWSQVFCGWLWIIEKLLVGIESRFLLEAQDWLLIQIKLRRRQDLPTAVIDVRWFVIERPSWRHWWTWAHCYLLFFLLRLQVQEKTKRMLKYVSKGLYFHVQLRDKKIFSFFQCGWLTLSYFVFLFMFFPNLESILKTGATRLSNHTREKHVNNKAL